jgi:hypothetical protein
MKNINFKIACFVFVFFFISISSFSQVMPMKNGFYLGYQGSLYYNLLWDAYFTQGYLPGLNNNFFQSYGRRFEYGDPLDGGFKDNIGIYQQNVNNLLNLWGNTYHNNALFLEREKVKRAGYGQLSDYQAELVPSSIKPRYGYENRSGTDFTETLPGGEVVSGINTGDPDNNNEHLLLSGLYENEEQIDYPESVDVAQNWGINYYFSDVKTLNYNWYILPRMKIRYEDAHLVTPKKVCQITIVPYDGATPVSFDIWTNYFRLQNGSYNEEYIDVFYNGPDWFPISITGSALNHGNPHNSDGRSSDPGASQVDYKIYWYGEVRLWVDRVRVADEWAFYLFHPELDVSIPPYDFAGKTAEECTYSEIGGHQNFGYFYIDEHRYNNLPCIAKMNEIIKNVKPNSGMISESNISLLRNYSGLVYPPSPDEMSDYLIHLGLINYYSLYAYKPVCL